MGGSPTRSPGAIMKLLTRDGEARNAARKFKEQYFCCGVWRTHGWDEEPEACHRRLLEGELTVARVKGILNETWVCLICDECLRNVGALVELGDEPECGSSTARACFPCLQKAMALRAAQEGEEGGT